MDLTQKIYDLTMLDKMTLEQMCLKLSEETGECSQALLSCLKTCGCEYKELTSEDVKEECVDVMIVDLSLFYKMGGQNSEIENFASVKLNKWEEKIGINSTEIKESNPIITKDINPIEDKGEKMKVFDILSILIWVFWLIYSVVGNDIQSLKFGLFLGSLTGIMFYMEKLFSKEGV